MLSWVLIFFVLAVVGVEMDFRHIAGLATEAAKVVFFALLVALVLTAIRRGLSGNRPPTRGNSANRIGESNATPVPPLPSGFTKHLL